MIGVSLATSPGSSSQSGSSPSWIYHFAAKKYSVSGHHRQSTRSDARAQQVDKIVHTHQDCLLRLNARRDVGIHYARRQQAERTEKHGKVKPDPCCQEPCRYNEPCAKKTLGCIDTDPSFERRLEE
jgi:hypothetical protein